jgi:hypothetical protein
MFVDIHAYHLRLLLVALAVSGVMAASAAQPGPAGMTVQKALPQREPAQGTARIVQNYGHLPLRFEANQGQTNRSVRFLSHGAGYALYLTDGEAVLALQKQAGANPARTDVVRMQIVGANTGAKPTGLNRLQGKSNYLLGDDPALWHTNIPAYSKVRYASVYPGVDLVYYGNRKQLEYDFVLAPHADPDQIRLHFAGAKTLNLDSDGTLTIVAEDGAIAFHKPVVYQLTNSRKGRNAGRRQVTGAFTLLADNSAGFRLDHYDHSKPLIIDPTLVYSTFLGGGTSDTINAIAVDSSGAAYVTGSTSSTDYPVTPGVFQSTVSTAFVTKINASGTALVYSSFLGGSQAASGGNSGNDIAVDSSGDAFIVGSTHSSNFPTTTGAFQTTNKAAAASGSNAFVTKVNPTGTALLYSTYLGGSTSDSALSLALDSSGDAYVAGYSFSSNFPTTTGAYQTTNKSAGDYGWNQFVTKVNPTGTALLYSTYIGGSGDYSSPSGIRVTIDKSGDAFLAGTTLSTDFPTTTGAYQTKTKAKTGQGNITLVKFNPKGSALLYSTYFGGSGSAYGDDTPNGLAVDSSGNAYFSGTTWESNFPVTSSAYQKTSAAVANGASSAFVTKINPAGSSLVYSTYLGGSGGTAGDRGNRLAIDSSGNVYLTGSAGSTDFPVTSNAYQSINPARYNNGAVVFLTEFNPGGTSLLYSTYMGGSNSYYDSGNGIALGSGGAVYLAGVATGSDFPTTPSAYNRVFSSQYSTTGFVSEFNLGAAPIKLATGTTLTSSANPAVTGSKVTFSASVVPATGTSIPAGNVVFTIDEVNVATVALSSKGWATYTTAAPLSLGKHAILATYQGNTTYSASGGNVTETITPVTPIFAPPGGIYPAAQTVTIGDRTASTAIYYTTNGTLPTASSTKYTGPIIVSVPETIRAIAILPAASSSVATASYSLVTAPTVLAAPASAIGTSKATLNALVNTFGMTGSFYFEYGTSSTALTNSTATTTLPASPLGSRIGLAPVPVSASITGLATKTTFYYRVVVSTPAGGSIAKVLSFKTN